MIKNMFRLGICAGFFTLAAFGGPVTWTFANGTFADGGTISGSFTYDPDIDLFSSLSIVTTAGSVGSGFTYKLSSVSFDGGATTKVYVFNFENSTTEFSLGLNFASGLGDAGGTVSILPGNSGPSFEREDTYPNGYPNSPDNLDYFRYISGGTLTGLPAGTPEPGTWLLCPGALGLVALKRRRYGRSRL